LLPLQVFLSGVGFWSDAYDLFIINIGELRAHGTVQSAVTACDGFQASAHCASKKARLAQGSLSC
jgi:hypothetical protein